MKSTKPEVIAVEHLNVVNTESRDPRYIWWVLISWCYWEDVCQCADISIVSRLCTNMIFVHLLLWSHKVPSVKYWTCLHYCRVSWKIWSSSWRFNQLCGLCFAAVSSISVQRIHPFSWFGMLAIPSFAVISLVLYSCKSRVMECGNRCQIQGLHWTVRAKTERSLRALRRLVLDN